VGEAGTVTLATRDERLELGPVRPTSGWTYELERDRDDEVEITFRRSGHGESTFRARLHGDELRVEIDPDGESPDD
jgi:hypothetical protein